MTSLKSISLPIGMMLMLVCCGSVAEAQAYGGHARIVRLSLVQGDVRFTREAKGDPLSDSRAEWEAAVLNLPIRQGYVVATDAGRAEVEFENGAMAFLAENSVLEFYDLSSEDGGFTTRLILRQGSGEFSVNPGSGDYFSVTGGDFSVQAEGRATFRINNFDDGSNVIVLHGRLTTLANGKETALAKGQSFSMRAGEADSGSVERGAPVDEFDQWVSGRIDTVSSATTAAAQYSSSYGGYTSGFADLYTYGGWYPIAGYGNCWRPYGVGFGWSPFDFGSWFYDPVFGWSFIGGQPWGWLPYHYGGWLFQPGIGWVWTPAGSFGSGGINRVGRWRPVTGVWMKSAGGVAIVPSHPLDEKGKAPLNMAAGMYAVTARGVTGAVPVDGGTKWRVERRPSRELMQNQLAEATAPTHLSRTMIAAQTVSTPRSGAANGDSTIIYDRSDRKYVNSEKGAENQPESTRARIYPAPKGSEQGAPAGAAASTGNTAATTRAPVAERTTASNVPNPRATPASPSRSAPAPPSVPRSVGNERVFAGGGEGAGSHGHGGATSTGASSGAASSHTGGSSTGATGGGRPH